MLALGRIHPCIPFMFLRRYLNRAERPLRVLASIYRASVLRNTKLVTVVGSNGKTSTTAALRAVLNPHQKTLSHSNHGASVFANLLCCRPGKRLSVLEVGLTGPGQMRRHQRALRPNVVVVTSIGTEHKRAFGTLDNTRTEKSKMLDGLGASDVAILNGDDPHVLWMASRTRARVVTFGFGAANCVRASGLETELRSRTRFTMHMAGEEHDVVLAVIGKHHVYAALAAIAVARETAMAWPQILSSLTQLKAPPGRMQLVTISDGAFVLDDSYKAPLESVQSSLVELAGLPAAHKIAVLTNVDQVTGNVGDTYRALGLQLAATADQVILVGSKDLRRLKTGAVRAGMPESKLTYVGEDVHKAIDIVREAVRPGTLVLIKGGRRRRLGRIKLALMGHDVRCRARECHAKVASCDSCRLLNAAPEVFENSLVRRFVHTRKPTALNRP